MSNPVTERNATPTAQYVRAPDPRPQDDSEIELPAGGQDLPVSEDDSSGDIRTVTIDKKTFGIRLADTEEGRNSVSLLVKKMYAWRGYTTAPALEDHPNRITLQAAEKGNVIGTVTLGVDSDIGIMADEVFKSEIDVFRGKGAKVCEITKLAFDHKVRSKLALAALFHTLYIYARHLHQCTDAFIEINPRHRRFYEHMLGFTRLGDLRENPRVKAPAYLLWVNLDYMEQQIKSLGGSSAHPGTQRSLYPFFFSAREEVGIVNRLLAID